jgi:hypothetical protein
MTSVVAQTGGTDLGKLISSLFSNPTSVMIFVIQLFLGIGLGYLALKALKYLLALAALIIIGIILNVWQAPQLDIDLRAVYTQIVKFALAFGLTTMLPLTIGFIIGALLGTLK